MKTKIGTLSTTFYSHFDISGIVFRYLRVSIWKVETHGLVAYVKGSAWHLYIPYLWLLLYR